MRMFLTLMITVLTLLALPAQASLFGNDGVQVTEFIYDFSVDGGAVSFINLSTKLNNALPSGASILRITYYVETAMTSAGSATVAIGDAGSGARYLAATAFDDAVFADEYIAVIASGIPHQVASANAGKFGVTVATAALTAGKIHFFVEFVQKKN